MNIPNPKRANVLVKEFIANTELEKELLKERLKKEAEINNAATLKVDAILKEAFHAALENESRILIDFSESSLVDISVKEILMAKGFYCEKNTEIIESKKWGIEACEKKRQDRYSDYANAIHRLRMHAYDRIIDHHKELKNCEIIASEILPLIFNELQLETNGWDFEYALNNLHGWSRLMNADYEEPGQLDVMNEEGEAAKPIKVVLLATSRHYDSVKNKTSACLGPSFSKNAKYSLDCLSNFLNITQELAAKRTDLEELEKNPSEDLYINWEGALFSKRENVEVDAHTLDWISNGTGGDALERLSTEIDTAARNGSKSLILTAEWFDHEDCFPTQNEMSYIFKELGFKVSPANNGIEVSWS